MSVDGHGLTEQNLFVRTGQFQAEVTNNERLKKRRRTVLLKLITYGHTTDKHSRAASLQQQSFLLNRRSRQRERLHAMGLSICLSVCLSPKSKIHDFLKN